MKYWDLTMPNVEATPKNVRIADRRPLRETRLAVARNVFLADGVAVAGMSFTPAQIAQAVWTRAGRTLS